MKKQNYKSYFPENSDSKAVADLQALVKQCSKELARVQTQFRHDRLRLTDSDRTELAGILVDFALDLQSGPGLWSALERCNTKLFGTPLPLMQPTGKNLPPGICRKRVQFLLWNVFPTLDPGSWLAPDHVDLIVLTESMTEWLLRQSSALPEISPARHFLDGPVDYGWEVKKKLVWLGMHSYLFRILFALYFEVNYDEEGIIGVIDDFLCQNTAPWSGLGAIDILAEYLDVPEDQKKEIRSWCLRHTSIYKIGKTNVGTAEAVNLVNDVPYRIREGAPGKTNLGMIRTGMTVFGSLVPWKGEWYWSGEQADATPYSREQVDELVTEHKQNTNIVARFWPEREKLVCECMEKIFHDMREYYGDDLAVLPDGRTWEREETGRLTAEMERNGLSGKKPYIPMLEELRHCTTGIGIYLDPVEGMETMQDFNVVRSALKKNGNDMTPEEKEILRDWIGSTSISPGFIHRAIKEYGGEESIKHAVLWKTDAPYWLDYLLRCCKGEYYRRRFPMLNIIEDNRD